MTDVDEALGRAARCIERADSVLVTSHRRPDGDGCGAMVALTSMLRRLRRNATLLTPDMIPRRYKWLPLADTAILRAPPGIGYDATVVIDCADQALVDGTLPAPPLRGTLIDLDHHASGRPFGDIPVCDPSAASAGVLIYRLAELLGWTIDPDAATGLYVSLISDTGWFRHSNTNGEALHVAARLVDCGAEPAKIAARLEERSSAAKLRLIGTALSTLEVVAGGKVAVMSVTQQMVDAARASWEDIEGLVNWARGVDGVMVGVVVTTARGGGTRVSMRGRPESIDVGQVAMSLGGGGHPGAAGCWLRDDLDAARARVIKALDQAIGSARGGAPVPAGSGGDPSGTFRRELK
jgi:bifunctional oligoribonuclease and PAP phosphatase NrnA